MKKIMLFVVSGLLLLTLIGCKSNDTIVYTNDESIVVASSDDTIKILQLTDQHLMYGFGENDRHTLQLIEDLATADDYDLIVLTGDQSMAPRTTSIYRILINKMESLEIPWTFVFGNHDNDFTSYASLLQLIEDMAPTYLRFKIGPALDDGGYGNFKIDFTYQNEVIYHAYLLDSKDEEEEYTEAEGEYGYLSEAQVAWYESHVALDTHESVVFMHVPLRQYMLVDLNDASYTGIFNEDKVYPQGVDTGFFQAMVDAGKSIGVFVGHDHLNDFSFMLDGILLAYGRNSGFSAYGNLDRGGRHIELNATGELVTYIVLERDVL